MTSDAPEAAPRSKKAPLFIIFVTVFIDLLGFGIVLPLLPRYAKAFNAEGLTIGLLMASFSAMQFVFAPIWGRVSDRIGRRPVLLLGLAGSTVFYGMFGYVTAIGTQTWLGLDVLTWLFLTRIGAGIAGATISTAQAYIADITGVGERTKGMALIGAAFGIGFTFGPLIGAACVSSTPGGAPSPMAGYVASGLSALAFLFAVARLPESLTPGKSAPSAHGGLSRIAAAMSLPGVGLALITIFLTTVAFAQFESTLSLLTGKLGLSEAAEKLEEGLSDRTNFFIFAYVGFVLSIAQGGIVRRLATRMKPQALALGGAIVMVAGLALIGLAAKHRSLGELIAFLPIVVLGFSALNPSLQSILSLRTPPERQGEVLGVGQSMSALARILGPIAGTKLFYSSDIALPYWVGAALMLLGAGLVLALKAPKTDAQAQTGGSPSH